MREIRAPRGPQITCRGWPQEAALRMLMNNLDPEVAERPQDLIVYGGTGKAARNWECFDAIVSGLRELREDETLLVQSGKPVGLFRTHELAPRVLISNSVIVPAWADWSHFRRYEQMGLTMYGQMTAGSWIYIGTQGILQGTYETFAAVAQKHFNGSLKGRLIVSSGLGGMGGAQPLAAVLNDAVFIGIECDPDRIQRRLETRYCDEAVTSLDEALARAATCQKAGEPRSIALLGNAAEVLPEMVRRNFIPDVLTDQTSAHDALNGYVPAGLSYTDALELRVRDQEEYSRRAIASMAVHVEAMLELKRRGAVTFDYGNNIRAQAEIGGVTNAFDIPGFVPEYIRPLFCEGQGPFRWAALSGDPEDIRVTDLALMEAFPEKDHLIRWLIRAEERVAFQGLPARICWLGYGERQKAGLIFNKLVRDGRVKGPLVIGRDHLDGGSVASPNRETEGMLDGSDAIGDWPVLNALLNTASGADWVSFHHGGGVGIGYSLHAGMVVVADGSKKADFKLVRVLTNDPGTAVMRHADAGYARAKEIASERGVRIPMKD